jgi:WD40 repeat protein
VVAKTPARVDRFHALLEAAVAAAPTDDAQSPSIEIVADIRRLADERDARPLPAEEHKETSSEFRSRELRWLLDLCTDNYRRLGPTNPDWDVEAVEFIRSVTIARTVGEPIAESAPATPIGLADPSFAAFDPLSEVGHHEARRRGRRGLDPGDAKELMRAGDELIRRSCDNPLVLHCWVYLLARAGSHPATGRLVATANRALSGYEELKYSPWVVLDLLLLVAEADSLSPPQRAAFAERAIAQIVRGLATPPADNYERRFLYRLLDREIARLNGKDLGQTTRTFLEHLGTVPHADPWLATMLSATANWVIASELRGQGPRERVRSELLSACEAHRRRSRALLAQAWKQAPENPEAAFRLIDVTRFIGGVAGESPRFWFDQAVSAQLDCPEAYEGFRNVLRATGGNEDLIDTEDDISALVAFAREGLGTGRFDTSAPMEYQATMELISSLSKTYKACLNRSGVVDDYRRLIAGYRSAARDPRLTQRADLWLASIEWLAGNRADALAAVPTLPADADLGLCVQMGLPLREFRDAVSAGGRPAGPFSEGAGTITAVQLADEGRTVLSGGTDGVLRHWNVADGRQVFQQKIHAGVISGIAVSPDGGRYATSCMDGQVALGTLGTLRDRSMPTHLSHGAIARVVAFSPDSMLLAVGGVGPPDEGDVSLWDVATNRQIARIADAPVSVRDLAFSPDGSGLAMGSAGGELMLWDLAERRKMWRGIVFEMRLANIAFAPSGRRLAVSGQDRIVMFPNGPGSPWTMPFDRIRVLDTTTRTVIQTLEGHRAEIEALAFLNEDKLLSGSFDRTLRCWDIASGSEVGRLLGPRREITACSLAPDQTWLIASDQAGMISRWDLPDENRRFAVEASPADFKFGAVTDMLVPADRSAIAAMDWEFGPMIWHAATGFQKGTILPEMARFRRAEQMVLSPDGTTLAVAVRSYRTHEERGAEWLGSVIDPCGEVRFWDVASGSLRNSLSVVDSPVHSLAYLNDDRTLLTGMAYGRIVLWDLTRSQPYPGQAIVVDKVTSAERMMNARGEMEEFRPEITALGCTSGGDGFAAGDKTGMIEFWKVPARRGAEGPEPTSRGVLRRLGGKITALQFSNSGERLLASVESTSGGPYIHLIDCGTLTVDSTIPGRCLAVSRDGRTLAVACLKGIQLIDFEIGKVLRSVPVPPQIGPRAGAFSFAGESVLTVEWIDQQVDIWNISTRLRVSKDDKTLSAALLDGAGAGPPPSAKTVAWPTESPAPIYLFHDADHHESRYAAQLMLSVGATIRIEVPTGTETVSSTQHLRMGPFLIRGVTFPEARPGSPTGDMIVSRLSIVARLLTDIDFHARDVSDASVPLLTQMQALKKLNVRQSQITAQGIDQIQNALQRCKIDR